MDFPYIHHKEELWQRDSRQYNLKHGFPNRDSQQDAAPRSPTCTSSQSAIDIKIPL